MFAHVAVWVGQYGYGAVFVVLFAESLGIPSPSEIVLVLAGYLISRNELNYPLTLGVATLGSTCGALVAYSIARRGGKPLVIAYGRRIGLDEKRLSGVEAWFERWGNWAIIVGRVVSGVRAVISYPAGLFGMPLPRFITTTAIGAFLWPLFMVTAGKLLGPKWPVVAQLMASPWLWVALLVAAAGFVFYWVRHRRRSQSSTQD